MDRVTVPNRITRASFHAPLSLTLTALALFVCLAPATAAQPSPDGRSITFNFGWEGRGALIPAPVPENPATTSIQRAVQARDNFQAWYEARGKPANPVMDVFRSPALTDPLYLNASRTAFLELALTRCAIVDIEVWRTDGVFLGGIHHSYYTVQSGSSQLHSSPSQSQSPACAAPLHRFDFRLQHNHVPAGTSIMVIVYPYDLEYPQYRLSGLSKLRLPLLTNVEAALRVDPERVSAPAGAGPQPAPVLAAIAPLVLGPRSRRHLLVAGLVLSAGFAGCLADPSRPAEPSSSTVHQPPIEGGHIPVSGDGSRGEIVGTVFDPFHQPVPGALLTLMETGRSVATDIHGTFHLPDLDPGAYRLRTVKQGYHVREDTVEVLAGKAAQLRVPLVPLKMGTGDEAPHDHDLFRGEERVRVAEMSFVVAGRSQASLATTRCGMVGTPPEANGVAPAYCESHPQPLPSRDKTGRVGNRVFPGTRLLEAELSWSGGPEAFRWAGLRVLNETGRMMQPLYPVQNQGKILIAVDRESMDQGHRLTSSWLFQVVVPVPTVLNQLDVSPVVTLTLYAHKGRIPIERPHPDFWLGNQTRLVVDGEPITLSYGVPSSTWRPSVAKETSEPGHNAKSLWAPAGNPSTTVDFGKRLVPPGTQSIQVTLEASRPVQQPRVLELHSARPGGHVVGFLRLAAGATSVSATLPVCDADTDDYYSQRSGWSARLVTPAEDMVAEAVVYADERVPYPPQDQLVYTMTVLADRAGPIAGECPDAL